jgi:hypothetical protein
VDSTAALYSLVDHLATLGGSYVLSSTLAISDAASS